MTQVRAIAKALLPPALLGAARRWTGRSLRFVGPQSGWQAACDASSGYADRAILDRVAAATRCVIAGEAAFERDSVLFAARDDRLPIVAGLMRAAALAHGRLHVIDFGGSLGSTYCQHRTWLEGLDDLRWVVVEQPAVVELGQREFSHAPLGFALTIAEASAHVRTPSVLASSVLQYVERPRTVLDDIEATDAKTLLIDRTPFSEESDDRVCVQQVPRRIYAASYPCWIFSRSGLLNRLSRHWHLVSEWPCDEGKFKTSGGLRLEFRGLYLERRQ